MITRSQFLALALPSLGTRFAPAQEDPVFRVDVRLAEIAVSVRGRRGGNVRGLTASQFRVFENGEPREIVQFYGDEQPATVLVLLDASLSARTIWRELLLALRQFLGRLLPESEAGLVTFNEEIHLVREPIPMSTPNQHELFVAAVNQHPDGRTALLDALAFGADQLQTARFAKRAMLLFGDGGDNASRTREGVLLGRLRRSAVVVHCVGISNAENPDQNFGLLRKIAEQSGGSVGVARNPAQLGDHFKRVADELSASYVLAFVPQTIGKPAELRVEVDAPEAEGKVTLRYRRQILPGSPVAQRSRGKG